MPGEGSLQAQLASDWRVMGSFSEGADTSHCPACLSCFSRPPALAPQDPSQCLTPAFSPQMPPPPAQPGPHDS